MKLSLKDLANKWRGRGKPGFSRRDAAKLSSLGRALIKNASDPAQISQCALRCLDSTNVDDIALVFRAWLQLPPFNDLTFIGDRATSRLCRLPAEMRLAAVSGLLVLREPREFDVCPTELLDRAESFLNTGDIRLVDPDAGFGPHAREVSIVDRKLIEFLGMLFPIQDDPFFSEIRGDRTNHAPLQELAVTLLAESNFVINDEFKELFFDKTTPEMEKHLLRHLESAEHLRFVENIVPEIRFEQ